MKKNLILSVLLLSMASNYAQVLRSIGGKSGLSLANQTWFYKGVGISQEKDYISGVYSAVTLDFFKSKYLGATADFAYCQKGNMETVSVIYPDYRENDSGTRKLKTRFNYLALNPFLKIKYEMSHFIPYILVGPRLDFQISYNTNYNSRGIENDFNRTIFGLTSGLGIECRFKQIGINTELQYLRDLTKIIDTPASAAYPGLSATNQAFVVSLGLKYYLQKRD